MGDFLFDWEKLRFRGKIIRLGSSYIKIIPKALTPNLDLDEEYEFIIKRAKKDGERVRKTRANSKYTME